MTTTPQMPVLNCTESTNIITRLRKITFKLTPVPTLNIRLLTVSEDPTVLDISGSVASISAGVCGIRVSTARMDLLYPYASSHSGLEVELVYDANFAITDLICSSALPNQQFMPAQEHTLLAMQRTLGEGDISASLASLNETVQLLLQATIHLTRVVANQQRSLESYSPSSADSSLPPPGQPDAGPVEPC